YYFRGESAPQTLYELIGKAVLAAVEDAGLTIKDVDGLAFYASGFEPGSITEILGIPEIRFASTVAAHGDALARVLAVASMEVQSGRAKAVVCIGACQQSSNRYGVALARMAATPESIWSRASGLNGPGYALALVARRHMHVYGTKREAFGEVV